MPPLVIICPYIIVVSSSAIVIAKDWLDMRGATRPLNRDPGGQSGRTLMSQIVGHIRNYRELGGYPAIVPQVRSQPERLEIYHYEDVTNTTK